MPLKIPEMIISLIVYLLIAYLLDVIISVILYKPKTEEEILTEAKNAFNYYVNNGKTKDEVIKMFQEKGWTKETLDKITN
jgi:hypothetical protein